MKQLKYIITICSFLLLSFSLFAQNLSSAEKFNKRGYFNNDDIVTRGNETISDYDGNFIFSYPLCSIDCIGELAGTLELTYNANVAHKFCDREGDPLYTVNAPEWIIGYKGIALQTFNFETSYYSYNYYNNTAEIPYQSTLYDSELPLLIPGYNKCNSHLMDFSQGVSRHDIIEILRSDGSKITLQNLTPDSKIGLYRELGFDNKGFAIVQYYDNPVSIHDGDGDWNYRKIIYKPGNGLSYIFYEELIIYGSKTNLLEDLTIEEEQNLVQIGEQSVFYLKEVYDHNGWILHFSYTRALNKVPLINGRKVLNGIAVSNFAEEFSTLAYLIYDNSETGIDNITIGNNKKDTKVIITLNQSAKPSNLFGILTGLEHSENVGSRILNISSIEDELGRKTDFHYSDNTSRKYSFDPSSGGTCDVFYNFKLIKEILYNVIDDQGTDKRMGKKTVLSFYDKVYSENYTQDTYPPFNLTTTLHTGMNIIGVPDNIDDAYRDCYTNFMLKERILFHNDYSETTIGEEIYRETFNYSKHSSFSFGDGYIYGIQTEKTITAEDYLDNINEVKTTKIYNSYKTDSYDPNTMDVSNTIKLVQEKTEDNLNSLNYVKKIFGYRTGEYVENSDIPNLSRFMGDFEYDNIVTTKNSIGGSEISSTQSFSYGNSQYVVLSDGTNNYSIRLNSWQEVFDGLTLYSYQQFKNFTDNYTLSSVSTFYPSGSYPDPWNANNYRTQEYAYGFYKIGVVEEEKVWDKNNKKSDVVNTYNDYDGPSNPDNPGTLHESTIYSNKGRSKTTNYIYEASASYRGLVSEIINSRGVTKLFSYPDLNVTSNNQVFSNIIFTDNSSEEITQSHNTFQLNPLKTTMSFNNKTIQYYTAYNKAGNLLFEVDANGQYSEFDYDKADRMTVLAVPGSFIEDGFSPFNANLINNFSIYFTLYEDNNTNQFLLRSINPSIAAVTDYYSEYTFGNTDPYTVIKKETQIFCGFFSNPITSSGSGILNLKLKLGFTYEESEDIYIYGIYEPITESISNDISEFVNTLEINSGLTFSISNLIEGEPTDVEIDLSSLITGNLYGIVISAVPLDNLTLAKSTGYEVSGFSVSIIPESMNDDSDSDRLTLSEQQDSPGTKLVEYDDLNNQIIVSDRVNPASQDEKIVSMNRYDGIGKLRESFIKDDEGNYELKSNTEYNYQGKPVSQTDGGGVTKNIEYDYLGRVKSEHYNNEDSKSYDYVAGGGSVSGTNGSKSYVEKIILTDEEDNTVIQYFDIAGNKVAEKVGDLNPTLFTYDNLYRLTGVTSPEGLHTVYGYDDFGNINLKTSPDEGTYRYMYDKWGNLRYEYHVETGDFVFNIYDDLNRLVISGIDTLDYDEDNQIYIDPEEQTEIVLDPDLENEIDLKAEYYVLVNVYDDFTIPEELSFFNFPAAENFTNLKGRLAVSFYRDNPEDKWNYKAYSYDYLGRVNQTYILE